MNQLLSAICEALDSTVKVVLDDDNTDKMLSEAYTWQYPPLDKNDIASLPLSLAKQLRDLNIEEVNDELKPTLEAVPEMLEALQETTIPNIFSSSGLNAYPAYFATFQWLNTLLQPLIYWETMKDNKMMPVKFASRLRSIQAGINQLEPDMNNLERQIKTINEATFAAESLPTDLESLRDAQMKVDAILTKATELKGKMDNNFEFVTKTTAQIGTKKEEADKLVEQCEVAYRITTSKGLAGAFDQRASRLNLSIYVYNTEKLTR